MAWILISLTEKLWLLLDAVPLSGKFRGMGKITGLPEDKNLFAPRKNVVMPTSRSCAA